MKILDSLLADAAQEIEERINFPLFYGSGFTALKGFRENLCLCYVTFEIKSNKLP